MIFAWCSCFLIGKESVQITFAFFIPAFRAGVSFGSKGSLDGGAGKVDALEALADFRRCGGAVDEIVKGFEIEQEEEGVSSKDFIDRWSL